MCLDYLERQFKAFDYLKNRFRELPTRRKIVCVIVVSLMLPLLLLWYCCENSIWPFNSESTEFIQGVGNNGTNVLPSDDLQKNYDKKVEKFCNHLRQVKRTKNGIKELEAALNTLNRIKDIESKDTIKDKRAISLTEKLMETCDELKKHFNEMRFSDYEDVKREGEQLYNAVENIKRRL